MGWGRSLTFSGYGKTFRKHRRLYQQHFSSQKAVQYRHTQLREARRLAFNLYEIGTDKIEPILNRWEIFMFEISFLTHVLDSFSTSIVSAIAYGYEVLSDDDPYLQLARESGYALSHCGAPGGTPVDLFPICTSCSVFVSCMLMTLFIVRHLPSWFPGTFFVWKAREYSHTIQQMQNYPFDEVRRQMVRYS